MKSNSISVLISAASLLGTVMGCGSESVDTVLPAEEPAATETALSGTVVMGPVQNADIFVYQLQEDGSRGELIASGLSNDAGEYSFSFSYQGAVEVVAAGGSYIDEATGETIVREDTEEIKTLLFEKPLGHVGIVTLQSQTHKSGSLVSIPMTHT